MALDALRGYLALASGLTEVSSQKAKAAAKALLNDDTIKPAREAGRQAQAQVQALADELMATSKANRDLLGGLVRSEVERAVKGLGFASADDVAALRAHIDRVERQVASVMSRGTAAQAPRAAVKKPAAARKAPAKKAAKKTAAPTAKKSTTKKATS